MSQVTCARLFWGAPLRDKLVARASIVGTKAGLGERVPRFAQYGRMGRVIPAHSTL